MNDFVEILYLVKKLFEPWTIRPLRDSYNSTHDQVVLCVNAAMGKYPFIGIGQSNVTKVERVGHMQTSSQALPYTYDTYLTPVTSQ